MAEYDAGSVFAQVIPSFRGVQQEIAKQAQKWGQTVQSTLADSISKGITDGLGEGTRKSAPESSKDGDKLGKRFADSFKARVKAALASLPDAKIGADATPAEKRIAELRADLQRLSGMQIGVDLDANAATARLDFIRSELARLSKDSPNVQVRVDAGRAAAQLAAIQAEVDKLDGKDVNVHVDKSGIQSFGAATSGVGLLAAALVPLGGIASAALVPVVGATVALGGAALGAVAGVGALAAVAVPAFTKISAAGQAQDKLNDAITQFGAGSKQAQAAAAKYQQQLALLTPAERSLQQAVSGAKDAFRGWYQALEPTVLPVFTQAIGLLKPVLDGLTPVVKGAADGLNRFVSYLGVVVNSPWFAQMGQMFGNLARVAIPLLGEAFVNIIQGIANLVAAFQPLIGPILRGLDSLTAKFKAWSASLGQSQGFKNFITFVQTNGPKLMSMLGAIGRAFVAIVKALAPIGAALIPVVTGIANFIASIPTWVLTAIAVGIAAIVAGFYAMSIAATVMEIAASPIILIVGGIIAALVALAAGIYFLVANWTTVWNWIKAIAFAAWSAISGFFITAWNFLVAVWTAVWNTVVGVFVGIWNWIKAVAIAAWTLISSFFMTGLNAFLSFFTFIWNTVVAVFVGVWNWIRNVAVTVWNAISGFFTAAFWGFVGFFVGIWNSVVAAFTAAWNWIRSTAVGIWEAIKAYFIAAFNYYKALFTNVWNTIVNVFRTVWDWIKNTAVSVWNAISGFFSGAFNSFIGFFKGIWDKVSGIFSDVWNGIKNTASSIWDGMKDIFKKGVNAIIGFLNGFVHVINKVTGIFGIPAIPDIPKLAAGGVVQHQVAMSHTGAQFLAKGGSIGGGFWTQGPQAIVGEGKRAHPEVVIPTDPQYRGRALALYAQLGSKLMASGGAVSGEGIPRLGIGSWLGSAWNWVSSTASSVWDSVTGFLGDAWNWVTGGVDGVWKSIEGMFGKAVPVEWFRKIGSGGTKKIISGVIDKLKGFFGGGNYGGHGGAAPAGQINKWILAALSILHKPASWAGGIFQQVMSESGGNPGITQQIHDVNSGGNEARGLMQVIPTTFRANMLPGHGNIFNPIDNLLAAIRYAENKYGASWFNMGPWHQHGYDSGGWLMPGATLAYNGTGKPEAIFTQDQLRGLTDSRGGQVNNFYSTYQTAGSPEEYAAAMSRSTARAIRGLG